MSTAKLSKILILGRNILILAIFIAISVIIIGLGWKKAFPSKPSVQLNIEHYYAKE